MRRSAYVAISMLVALLTVSGCAGQTDAQMPVSEALRQDAEAYAEAHNVPLDEAIWRLRTQDPVGELQAVLQEKEADVFSGLWIEHEPVYKVVVLVTRGQRRIKRRYIRGGPLVGVAEVRKAERSLAALTSAHDDVVQILEAVDSRAQTGIDVKGNCVALYSADPGTLLTEVDAAGLVLPEPVCIVDTGSYAEAPPVDPPPGIVFPRQHPPEGLREEMAALLIGELTETDGCLRVRAEDDSYLVIWPYDYTVTAAADGAIQIRDGSGAVVARVGDVVRMGGGEVPAVEGLTTTEAPAQCGGPYWLASGEIEQAQ